MAALEDHVRKGRKRFREILNRDSLTIMPGGFSPLYARISPCSQLCRFFEKSQAVTH